jgi:hypothetical protein
MDVSMVQWKFQGLHQTRCECGVRDMISHLQLILLPVKERELSCHGMKFLIVSHQGSNTLTLKPTSNILYNMYSTCVYSGSWSGVLIMLGLDFDWVETNNARTYVLDLSARVRRNKQFK